MIKIRKFKEVFKKRDIDDLKKDFGFFTKDIRRVNNGEDLFKLLQASRRWKEYFDDLVYQKILGIAQYKGREEDTPLLRDVQTKAWSLYLYVDEIFNPERLKEFNSYYLEQNYPGYGSSKYSKYPELWEKMYTTWSKYRDGIYQKATRIGRECFKALYDYIEYKQGSILDKKVTSTIKINGMLVTRIHLEDDKGQIDFIKNMQNRLLIASKEIESAGFGTALKGLSIELNPQENAHFPSSMVAGFYEEKADRMVIRWLGDKDTIIHEIGHRYYSIVLKEIQKKEWVEFVDADYITIEDHQWEILKQAFWKSYKVSIEDVGWFNTSIWKELIDYIKDDETKYLYQIILSKDLGVKGIWFNDDQTTRELYQDYWDRFYNSLKDERILKNAVSEYGGTNPKEAFAETFMMYCSLRHRKEIPELAMIKFLDITGIRK